MITIICKQCGLTFDDYPSNKRQYCGRICADIYQSLHPRQYMSKKISSSCLYCHKVFVYYPSLKRLFCSRECRKSYDTLHGVSDAEASPRTIARRKKAAGLTKPAQIYFINEAFFFTWSDNLAWILGLIWSDGNLSRNQVRFVSKDKDMLDTVAHLIGHNIGPIPRKNTPYWRMEFASYAVSQHLRSIGLLEAKSLVVGWPNIPEAYEPSFIRGLIDGDGTIRLSKNRHGQQVAELTVALCGASLLRIGYTQWLYKHNIPYYFGWRKDWSLWRINIHEQQALRYLYPLLYPSPDVPCLQRKRIPYDQWIARPRIRVGAPAYSALPNPNQLNLFALSLL